MLYVLCSLGSTGTIAVHQLSGSGSHIVCRIVYYYLHQQHAHQATGHML